VPLAENDHVVKAFASATTVDTRLPWGDYKQIGSGLDKCLVTRHSGAARPGPFLRV